MVEVVDAYECRTGIEEGGVKKTIVVRTIPAIYNLYYKIHNTRNIQNLQYAKSRSMRGQISKTMTQTPGALCMLSRLPEVQGGVRLLQGHHEVPGGDGEGARRGGVLSNG